MMCTRLITAIAHLDNAGQAEAIPGPHAGR